MAAASTILRRIERGERCWPAELGLRGLGAALLALCAGLGSWLYRACQLAPAPATLHAVGALVAVACWSLGWALLAEGPALFRLVPRPRGTVFPQF